MRLIVLLGVCVAVLSVGRAVAQEPPREPVGVILDTDMNLDIDDMLALSMLHALQSRGEDRILAITCSVEDKWGASYIDLFDTFYGRPEIPVGLVRGGFKPESPGAPDGSPLYTQYLLELRANDGSLVFPHALTNGDKSPDPVVILRKALSQQPDNSVVMIEIGASTNFIRLLDSKSDAVSRLNGVELVRRKVRFLSIMAGNFGDVSIWGHAVPKGDPETNIGLDVPAAQRLFATWPTAIVASGFEVGGSIVFPGSVIQDHFNFTTRHPVPMTYKYADKIFRDKNTPAGKLHDHYTWDLTAVLYGIRPNEGYFSLSAKGKIAALDNAGSKFEEREGGNSQYLVADDKQRARVLEAMELLVTQPPQRR